MSRVTKIKHVLKEQEADDFDVPTGNQRIVRIFASRGNNLHEVEPDQDGEERFLVSMPVKFRKNVWIKRGDFVLVEPIEEGNKVKAEISRILTPEHIKVFEKEGVWPRKFSKKRTLEDDLDEDGLFRNTNRKFVAQSSDDDDDDDEEEEDEETSGSEDDENDDDVDCTDETTNRNVTKNEKKPATET